jgi:hypothetical protein
MAGTKGRLSRRDAVPEDIVVPESKCPIPGVGRRRSDQQQEAVHRQVTRPGTTKALHKAHQTHHDAPCTASPLIATYLCTQFT